MEKMGKSTESIANQKRAFDNLKANTFVLVDVNGSARSKTRYDYVHDIFVMLTFTTFADMIYNSMGSKLSILINKNL